MEPETFLCTLLDRLLYGSPITNESLLSSAWTLTAITQGGKRLSYRSQPTSEFIDIDFVP